MNYFFDDVTPAVSTNSRNDVTFHSQRKREIIFALLIDSFSVPFAKSKKGEPFCIIDFSNSSN